VRRHRDGLASLVLVFGSARPHHAYLFANRSATRMNVLVRDGIGLWLAARLILQTTGDFYFDEHSNLIDGCWKDEA
jgi:IS66 Orf2 like protein